MNNKTISWARIKEIWRHEYGRSILEPPVKADITRYECSVADFLGPAVFAPWWVDQSIEDRFVEYGTPGARLIPFLDVLAASKLRRKKLRELTRWNWLPRTIIERCTKCKAAVVKDGCHRTLYLAHTEPSALIEVYEIASDDWSHSVWDMKHACTCLR